MVPNNRSLNKRQQGFRKKLSLIEHLKIKLNIRNRFLKNFLRQTNNNFFLMKQVSEVLQEIVKIVLSSLIFSILKL